MSEINRLYVRVRTPSRKVTSTVALLIFNLLEVENARIFCGLDELDNNLTPFSANEDNVHHVVNEVFIF